MSEQKSNPPNQSSKTLAERNQPTNNTASRPVESNRIERSSKGVKVSCDSINGK